MHYSGEIKLNCYVMITNCQKLPQKPFSFPENVNVIMLEVEQLAA